MKIWLHPYELHPVNVKQATREGVLVKVEWVPGQIGYSDLHPWPEFGEPTIEEQIQDLAKLKMSPLVERSLDFNFIDFQFRAKQRNAFLGLVLPRVHKLVFAMETLTMDDLLQFSEEGYTHIKVKMGHDLKEETKFLICAVAATKLLWRIDFNGRLQRAEFTKWWTGLDAAVRKRIDFIEDPIATGQLEIVGPWARDWKNVERAKIRVIKPARENGEDAGVYERVIFTHSLEHIYGQACSLWAAARYYSSRPKRLEICGLGHTGFYQADDFSRAWTSPGPRMKPTLGTGFGFDELLNELKWDKLL